MDVAAWIELAGALAALAGSAVSVIALVFSHRANSAAEEAREESKRVEERAQSRDEERNRREQEREAREAEREKRLMAGCLQAWWGRKVGGPAKESWGVLVSNDGPYSAVFRDVEIEVSDANAPQLRDLHLRTVPPGFYYCVPDVNAPGGWKFPQRIPDLDDLQPVTQSSKHQVCRMRFDDQVHTRWEWTAEGTLVQIPRG